MASLLPAGNAEEQEGSGCGLTPTTITIPRTEDSMNQGLRLAKKEIYSLGGMYQSSTPCKRKLGNAIVLAAIEDYRGMDSNAHRDAEQFLYPETEERRNHFAWAVALAEGVNPEWLRDALDRSRSIWDAKRLAQTAWKTRSLGKRA
jgi:hypothetical protein